MAPPPRGLSVKGAENGGGFGMDLCKCGQLAVATAEMRAQFLVVVAVVEPATVIEYQRRDDDPRRVRTDFKVSPDVGAGKLPAFFSGGLHVAAAVWHAWHPDEIPHRPVIVGQIAVGVEVHVVFGPHEVVAKQRRKKMQPFSIRQDRRWRVNVGLCVHQISRKRNIQTVLT